MDTENQIQHNVRIVVPPSNWGEGRRENVERLIRDTASHVLRLLRDPFTADIRVIPRPIDEYPEVMYRSPNQTRYTIKLSTRDTYWAQYAYQFAHEFCHVLFNHEQLKKNPNNWFHEAICELASVFTLRRMAERWHLDPPYPNWASFADNLDKYCKKWMGRPETQLPEDVSLQFWLLHNEDTLRVADYRKEAERNKQHLVAYQLLPIFEDFPVGWNAIRNLPTSTGYLKDYLNEWHSLIDLEDQPFVGHLSNAFGYTIGVGNASDQ